MIKEYEFENGRKYRAQDTGFSFEESECGSYANGGIMVQVQGTLARLGKTWLYLASCRTWEDVETTMKLLERLPPRTTANDLSPSQQAVILVMNEWLGKRVTVWDSRDVRAIAVAGEVPVWFVGTLESVDGGTLNIRDDRDQPITVKLNNADGASALNALAGTLIYEPYMGARTVEVVVVSGDEHGSASVD